MNLQPYKVTIVNKSATELAAIPQNVLAKDFHLVKDLFMPCYGLDALTEIFMASPESISQLIQYYKGLGIEISYSHKKGREFIVNNQNTVNRKGNVEFICSSIQYLVDHCNEDEIYSKLNHDKVTPADQFILETA